MPSVSPTDRSKIEKAKKSLGELFIIGFNGMELSEETQTFIREAGIGGIQISALNFESLAQLAELSNQAQECRQNLPLWIATHHEGGRAQRLKKQFTRLPEAAALAESDSPKLAFELSEMMAKELRAVGINLNFGPVVDVATVTRNLDLSERAYGSTEERVSKVATALVRGTLVGGVQPCVKHFPGLGSTSTDPEVAQPRVDTSRELLLERDIKPFTKAFKSRCSWVMVSHIVCTQIDPKYPASLSPAIVGELLRKELRYSRIVMTDEMEMKAITDHFGPKEAALLALKAGCDVLLYRTENAARVAYTELLAALDDGRLNAEQVIQSAERIRALKDEALVPYQDAKVSEVGKLIGIPAHQTIVQKVTQSS